MTTETKIFEPFTAAEKVAPEPGGPDASRTDWARHYAAFGLAAHAAFRIALKTNRDSGPELGMLTAIGTSSLAAAVALLTAPDEAAELIWNLTPEAGALNGEYVDWLAETLDLLGVNPADIEPHFSSADFSSPTRLTPAVTTITPSEVL